MPGCGCPGGVGGTNALPTPGTPDCTSSGGTGCLAIEELILMIDGSTKSAGDVQAGDKIKGLSPEGVHREQTIHRVQFFEEETVSVKFGQKTIICSESHPFFLSNGSALRSLCLDPEDELLSENGDKVKVVGVKRVGIGKVVGWQCSPDSNFFVGGVLSHNKTAIEPQM